jgi:hypothetical protein
MAIAEDIIEKVQQKELDTKRLRERWNSDYDLWTLQPYTGAGAGYRAYTSNEPRTNAKKAIGMLAGAAMTVRVPQGNDGRDSRDDDNAKERFLLGNFKANDERLVRAGVSGTLRQAMAWSLVVRGTTCGRSQIIRRNGTGRALAEAVPWDPMDCFWEYGPEGLAWICHRGSILRTRLPSDWGLSSNDSSDEPVTFWDYYDTEKNIVVIPDIKDTPVKNEFHGLFDGDGEGRVPAWVMANTLQPLVHSDNLGTEGLVSRSQLSDSMADFGESIFADSRHQFETSQLLASIRLELAARSRKPVFSVRSPSGVKVIEFDPFKEGSEFPLQTGDEFIVHDMLKSAPDTDPLAAMVASEEQKGLFPIISFGGLPDPISGFAIQNLKGGVADKVLGAAQAMSAALMLIADNWSDHFATGAFEGQELSGQGRNRKWFSSTITFDQIIDLAQAEIEIVPELPEDQAGKIQMAMALRQSGADGLPLEPDYVIREEYLRRQDSDMDLDAVMQQMASQHPMVQAYRYADALAKRNDPNWKVWASVWNQMLIQAMQSGLSLEGIIPPDEGPEEGGAGFSPDVLPNAAQGIPSPTPGIDTPLQQGPLVPAGTPRPGAQNGNAGPNLNALLGNLGPL